LSDLKAKGFADDNPAVIQARQEIQALTVSQAQQQLSMAVSPTSAAVQIAATQAGGERSLQRLTTGDPAKDYALGLQSIGAIDRASQELRAGRAAYERENGAYTPAMEAAYQRRDYELKIGRQQQVNELGIPGWSPGERMSMSDSSTRMNIMQMTYAGQGDIRNEVTNQMGILSGRLSKLSARRSDMKRQGLWNDELEAGYTESKNQTVTQAAGLQRELEEGWMDRIISQSFNMPGNSRLVTSQFTHREASMFAGIYSRAFGGDQAQMRYAREQFGKRWMGRNATDDALAHGDTGGHSRIAGDGFSMPGGGIHGSVAGSHTKVNEQQVTVTIRIVDDKSGKVIQQAQQHLDGSNAVKRIVDDHTGYLIVRH
jgi:hypothetical protein